MTERTVDPIYLPFAILTPPATLPDAPLVTVLDTGNGTLEQIDLRIPPGHSAQTGIRFALAGQQILPWSNAVTWITDDDLHEPFAVGVEVSTQLTAITFNTGNYPHTFYLRLRVRQLPSRRGVPTVALLDNGAL